MMLTLVLFFFFAFSLLNQLAVCDFNFSFPSFDSNSCSGNNSDFICLGSAIAQNRSLIITPDDGLNKTFLVGRVLYRTPVLAWPVSFSSTFTVRMVPYVKSIPGADGMAFIMAQDNTSSPPQSYGSFLGILGPSTQGGVVPRQLAVELDTFKNEIGDPDGNHIAIDTVSVQEPVIAKSLNDTGIDLKSGREITLQIAYNGWDKILQIYVAYAGRPLTSFLSQKIIMKDTVPSRVYLGFSGATGTLLQSHQILSWNFTSTELPASSLKTDSSSRKSRICVLTILPVLTGCLILAAVSLPFLLRYLRRERKRKERRREIENLTRSAANVPKMFTYWTLAKATKNFSKENLLGSGGFGSVYKGQLSDPPMTIAVKKISATSSQGEKEYLAEICTIGRLRHKNLVQLQGWCHDHDELLLIYDYMENGSLEKYIEKISLSWEVRYKILSGLASALVYLHEECGNPVVHRDIKPSNVLLNSEFNAHLGDFGLARLIQNDKSMTTMVAGTLGYLAPEVSYTGRATLESDVYSFGMVVLEVVCGKRTKWIIDDPNGEAEKSLVEYVWESYENGEIINCVDPMLQGEFDMEQAKRTLMVGLACLYPSSMHRPKMRKVVQIFIDPMEQLMDLPASQPMAFFLPIGFSTPSTSTNLCSSTPTDDGGHREPVRDETTISILNSRLD